MLNLDSYYPFDSGPGATNNNEDNWRLLAQNWGATAVIAGYPTGELSCFADSTGMVVKVNPGACLLLGHRAENTSVKQIAIGPNASGNSRIDRVVVRLDTVANTIGFEVIQGTPGVSPSAPSITRSATIWDLPIAQVTVGNGVLTILAGNVTDERALWSTLFGCLVVPTTTVRDLHLPAPANGTRVLISSAPVIEQVRVGGAWVNLSSVIADLSIGGGKIADATLVEGKLAAAVLSSAWTAPTLSAGWSVTGGGTVPLGYKRIGNVGFITGTASRTGAGGSNLTLFTLPVGFRPAAQHTVQIYDGTTSPIPNIHIRADGVVAGNNISNGNIYSITAVYPIA